MKGVDMDHGIELAEVGQLDAEVGGHDEMPAGSTRAEGGSKRAKIGAALKQVTKSKTRGYDTLADPDLGPSVYAMPERPTACDYILHPFRGFDNFRSRLVANFGSQFTIMIGCNYLFVKGMLLSIMGLVRLSYCKKTLGVDGAACQTLGAIGSTPWAIKGGIGVISDAYPLFGYHKSSYVLVTAVLGTASYFCLAALPIHTPVMAGAFIFLANFQIATADLLCEGQYASAMNAKPHTGSAMVSFVWGCFQFGALIAALFVGPIADSFNPQIIFWLCIPLAMSIVIPTALGYLGDEKVHPGKEGVDWAKLREHPYIIGYCMLMMTLALGNGILDVIFFDNHVLQLLLSRIQFVYAIGASLVLCVLAFLWLPPLLARCNFYMFLSNILYVNIGGAQDFWFTAGPECVPGGPAFDYTYYNTYTWVVGAFTGWVGIVLFQATMSGWTFRKLFWVTTVIQCVAAAFDLLMIGRYNIAWGVSDKLFYMFGDAVIGPAVGMFAAMPALVLTSKLVPKGLEATTYALLAGFQNFGGVVSSQIGIYATQWSGVKTTEPCDFKNLSALVAAPAFKLRLRCPLAPPCAPLTRCGVPCQVLVCHCLLPLIAVPLTFCLIPDKLMTDAVLPDDGPLSAEEEERREEGQVLREQDGLSHRRLGSLRSVTEEEELVEHHPLSPRSHKSNSTGLSASLSPREHDHGE